MSQIRDGLVNVTKGSATVTGTNTEFTLASVGSLFIVSGDRVSYTISQIVSDTEITLTSPYGGVTNSLVNYTIHTSLTPNRSYPYPTRSDIETATIVATAIKRIDADVTPFNYRGAWTSGTSYSEKDMVVHSALGVVSLYIANQNHVAASANEPPNAVWDLIFSTTDLTTIIYKEMHWMGQWVANTQYYEQNVVRYLQSIYVAKNDNLTATFNLVDWDYLIDVDELEQYKLDAIAARDKAELWADAPLNTAVEPGKYSARHWAEQLGAIPETAYNWKGTWSAGVYSAGDAVYHAPSRSSYITLIPTSDEPHIDGLSNWQLLAKASFFDQATFTDLSDTPSNYIGQSLGFLQVNLTANGIVFTQVPNDNKPYIVKNGEFVEWNWGL